MHIQAVCYPLHQLYKLITICKFQIISELHTFDEHVNKSFGHSWKLPNEQEELVHYPSPSYGVDTNTTFEVIIYNNNIMFASPH